MSDGQRDRLRLLLPPEKPRTGRPGKDPGAIIRTKANGTPDPTCEREAYPERTMVDRLSNRLKRWHRLTARYEKRAAN